MSERIHLLEEETGEAACGTHNVVAPHVDGPSGPVGGNITGYGENVTCHLCLVLMEDGTPEHRGRIRRARERMERGQGPQGIPLSDVPIPQEPG
jgi:hypothetical protein